MALLLLLIFLCVMFMCCAIVITHLIFELWPLWLVLFLIGIALYIFH